MERLHTAPSAVELTSMRTRAAARLANVIIDPLAAFRGIDVKPTWALAFAALIALRFGSLFAFYRPDASPLKLVAGVLFQMMAVGPAVVVLALGLWTIARLWGVRVSWSSALAVTVHVMFAYTLATVVVASVAGALLPASAEVELRNPPYTNLAFLAGSQTSAVVRRLLAAADVRMVYAFALTYLGVAEASPDRAAAPAEASPDRASAAAESSPGGHRRRAGRVVVTCVALQVIATIGAALARG